MVALRLSRSTNITLSQTFALLNHRRSAIMSKPISGAEALKALRGELQTRVNDLMSELSAFNEDLVT